VTVQTVDKYDTLDARPRSEEMRDFARVLKAALLMIVRYLEKRYCV
jgi:hypothetical protein